MNTPSHVGRRHFTPVVDAAARRPLSLRVVTRFVVLAGLAIGSSVGTAQIAYNEAISGDLSSNGLIPTIIAVHAGSNTVFGTTGRVGATIDRDYFTFAVPPGLALTAVLELPGTVSGGVSFFGLQAGPQVTLPVTTTVANGLLGWDHYASTVVSTDIFPILQIPLTGSSGFSGPLGAGNYSVWIQDFSAGNFAYGFDFRLSTAVPEPSTYALMGGALLLVLTLRRRHATTKAMLP